MKNYISDEYNKFVNGENFAEESKEKFCVDSLDSANWTFRMLVKLSSIKNKNAELAAKEIERINSWLEKENKNIDNSIAYFEGLLRDYYIRERDKDDRFRLSTPYGKVTSSRRKNYEYNEELLLDELKNTEYIVIKESVDKNKLKSEITVLEDGHVVTRDGVVLEGLTVSDKVTYSVKPIVE